LDRGLIVKVAPLECNGAMARLVVLPLRSSRECPGPLTARSAAVQAGGLSLYFALPTLLEAGVNIMPPGVIVLGAGTLVFGVRPRLSAVAAALIGIIAFLRRDVAYS